MANSTTMVYGAYSFSPVPLLTISKEMQKTDDQSLVGTVFRVTLRGTLTPLPGDSVGGYDAVDALQDELKEAFDIDGKHFLVMCGATTLIDAYPRINNIQFEESSNNWVLTTPFTIEIEFDDDPTGAGENSTLHPEYIESASDSWNIEFIQENLSFNWNLASVTDQVGGGYYGIDSNPFQLRLSHTVSAKGKRHYSGPGATGSVDRPAWQEAREYVVGQLGLDTQHISSSGVINLDASSFAALNHFRQQEVDELGGTMTVTETWLVLDPSGVGQAGSGNATEDFTVNINKSVETDLTTVNVEGTIQGLMTRDYGTSPGDFAVTETAESAAESYWSVLQARLLSRVQYAAESTATRNFNPTPLSQSVGRSPSRGNITYAYSYNDRPCSFITGALTENFTISEQHPTDVFASLPVLGRPQGPVLQEISTITQSTREVSIEVVMPPPSACTDLTDLDLNKPTTNVTNLLCDFEQQLTDVYTQVFKHADTESWNPLSGRYSRQVGWTFQDCSGTAPSTSFCPGA